LLISLGELKPSPWNPKKPFTKKQLEAVKACIAEFDFKRSLCVCKDFQSGEGFFVLDGNDAIIILKELGKKKVDCHIVEKVVDEKTLQQFMAGYSINKQPLYSEFALSLGKMDFSKFTGLDYSKFSFDVKIDNVKMPDLKISSAPTSCNSGKIDKKTLAIKPNNAPRDERQTQYFLTLPPDSVDKLKKFVKTKAFNHNKTDAIAEKIDAMNSTQFLENILQIIL